MLPFGVTIPATVPQGSEIPEGLMNNPVYLFSIRAGLSQTIRIQQGHKQISRMDGWMQRHCGTWLNLRTCSVYVWCEVIFREMLNNNRRFFKILYASFFAVGSHYVKALVLFWLQALTDICRVCEFRDSRSGKAEIPFFWHTMLRQRVIW
jgi:hypothetical protein